MATISTNDIKIRYDIDLTKLQQATEQFDKITAEERALLRELGKLKKQLDDAAESAKKFGKETNNSFSDANNGMNSITSSAGKLGGVLAGIFAVSQIKQFASAVLETTIKFEAMRKAIDFASGSAEMGQKNFEFVRQTAQKLGLDLKGAVEGYKTFASAANIAGQSSQETNRQFAAVAKAAQVMGLSAEDTKGAFLALGQMMSKGNVQAEELRGQLGERLVGAFGIAAKAMGVTTGELNKMLQKGQVLAADFLPKFATELENTFGKGNTQVTTLAASQNRFNSSIDQLILAIGNKLNPFLKGAYDLAAGIATSLSQAAGGNKAAQATADQIAARRVESELAQKILDISIKQGVFISRQSAARALLGEIEQRITNAQLKQVDARLTKDNLRLQAATKEISVLQEQEKIYEKIAGVIVTIPPPPPPIDPKELKKEYEERLKMLELLKEQRKLIGELYNDPLANIGAEKAFLEAKLKLQKEYSVLFTKVEIGNTNLQRLNAEKEFNKQAEALRMENYKSAVKSDEDLQKERAKMMKDNLKNMEDDQKRQAEIVKEMTRIIEDEERRRQAIREKALELGQTLTDGAFNIYQANLSNEMASLQKRYDEEVRLADGNVQKLTELEEKKNAAEREIKLKQFRAEQAQAVTRIIFETASIFAAQASNPFTAPLAALTLAIQAAQIGLVLAQPVPEFAEGTKGKPFKGGKAIVGERGVEKVVTESGKVYFTPPTATLVDLPKGSQVIPNHSLSRQEVFLANHYANRSSSSASSPVVGKLDELGSILKGLPITQLNMDERGFEKFIRTPRRSTKILNNRFGINN
jgi:tape measure domain-containing protein